MEEENKAIVELGGDCTPPSTGSSGLTFFMTVAALAMSMFLVYLSIHCNL